VKRKNTDQNLLLTDISSKSLHVSTRAGFS
jgi:hypothetical protein